MRGSHRVQLSSNESLAILVKSFFKSSSLFRCSCWLLTAAWYFSFMSFRMSNINSTRNSGSSNQRVYRYPFIWRHCIFGFRKGRHGWNGKLVQIDSSIAQPWECLLGQFLGECLGVKLSLTSELNNSSLSSGISVFSTFRHRKKLSWPSVDEKRAVCPNRSASEPFALEHISLPSIELVWRTELTCLMEERTMTRRGSESWVYETRTEKTRDWKNVHTKLNKMVFRKKQLLPPLFFPHKQQKWRLQTTSFRWGSTKITKSFKSLKITDAGRTKARNW